MKHFLVFILAFVLSSIIYHVSSLSVNAATLTACAEAGCSYVQGDGLQQAIDAAKDGDTIIMQSGNYRRNTFTPIEVEKYNQCFISTKGKNLTIRGEGKALIEGQNDELGTGVKGMFRVGVCIQKGKVTIDNIWVQQTLSHAFGLSETEATITNVYTADIDNIPVMIRRGTRAIIANSFINGPMFIDDDSSVRVINNTFYGGGVHLNLCRDRVPTAEIFNNIFSYNKYGIEAECLDQEKSKGIKAGYNLVWKYGSGDGVGDDSKPLGEPDCSSGEICDFPGRLIASPSFKAPAIYGDVAWSPWTDFHFKDEGSAAKGAGEGGADLGMYGNACTSGGSQACKALSVPFPTPSPTPTESPQPITNPGNAGTGGQGQSSFRSGGNITNIKSSIEYVLNNLKFTNEGTKEADGMDLVIYIAASAVYIMVIHFAVGIKSEFNIFLMIIYFVLGGVVGGWLHTYEGGLAVSIILSLLFI